MTEPSKSVCIQLSQVQVDQIVRGASDAGNLSGLLSGPADVRAILTNAASELENPRMSRSLLAGLLMLASFPSDGGYTSIAELSRTLDMSPSTTHRYVSTLLAAGLLDRDPRTRRYRLADAG
jgi:Fic family protein